MNSTDLAVSATTRELVAAFVAAEREVRGAFAQIVAAEKAVNAAFSPGEKHGNIRVSASGPSLHDNFDRPDEAVAIMARRAWKMLVDRLGLQKFMSVRRWNELQAQLDDNKAPPQAITEDNVLRFARAHLDKAREYLQESVAEVFDWLRPSGFMREAKLKTNSQLEVPAKVILDVVKPGLVNAFGVKDFYRQRFNALERVFRALDGRGEIRGWQSELETAIEASPTGEGETDLFRFRCYQNGALHLWFRRPDLLARFNAMAGGARLRPAPTVEDAA